ncbi:MAG: polyprenyl synthetase family protein [Erysipelotrichaceae bacterium]|nr:polyprenyl synthetase family protein [Erysipelotrichaceae bacterium]MDY5251874.1 farnesyl diphosphate synthase [Erysipelotrichaceae bacterium]
MKFEDLLIQNMNNLPASMVKEAAIYALNGKGKRVRPKLLYAVVAGYGHDQQDADKLACAIEMVHTYSLIHDDLPAMDNDELRRGRATCHIAYDEATAILAGDALLTQAFYLTANATDSYKINSYCTRALAQYAGAAGMIYGQELDIQAENLALDLALIKKIHFNKTGCLLACPLIMGAYVAQRYEDAQLWHEIGLLLGLAFQVQDDILDVTSDSATLGKSNSDLENNKQNICRLMSIENAKEMMDNLYEQASKRMEQITDFDPTQLRQIIDKLKVRTN